ncbi:signal peptidase [Clostridioides difficile]|nr:signal peptidase [Clostridioides difficile]MBH7672079.1 signal peptidase [Clostridioides difficile]MBY1803781.1 signal peptidase [Clostridioides difficile]MBZ1016694.1 signal peptidase [Clostridioides difficile]MDN9901967.1 signal peptidase [Clostridioides difficile]
MVCKVHCWHYMSTIFTNFILTKWYVKTKTYLVLPFFLTHFILTMWYVKSSTSCATFLAASNFILTMWYVKVFIEVFTVLE